MTIDIVDTLKLAHEKKKRTVVMDTRKMHAWVHYYPNPGDHDELHCHPGDQTFMCLEGQCTMHFPDGGKAVLNPSMVALIRGGSFYKLENSGPGPLILMGTRTGPNSENKHIDYVTGEDLRGKRPPRQARNDQPSA